MLGNKDETGGSKCNQDEHVEMNVWCRIDKMDLEMAILGTP